MYVPAHFAMPNADVQDLMGRGLAWDLVTPTTGGLVVTMLPLLHEGGSLVGHVARTNDHWRAAPTGASVALLRGPDGYVSPSWYATKAEHGRVVPTWDYVTVHAHGELVVHDDPAWLRGLVTRLTDHHEQGRWQVTDAPEAYVAGQLRAIVGVELRISRLEGKAKLSQNRAQDLPGIVEALGDTPLGDAVRTGRA